MDDGPSEWPVIAAEMVGMVAEPLEEYLGVADGAELPRDPRELLGERGCPRFIEE